MIYCILNRLVNNTEYSPGFSQKAIIFILFGSQYVLYTLPYLIVPAPGITLFDIFCRPPSLITPPLY